MSLNKTHVYLSNPHESAGVAIRHAALLQGPEVRWTGLISWDTETEAKIAAQAPRVINPSPAPPNPKTRKTLIGLPPGGIYLLFALFEALVKSKAATAA